MDPAPPASLVQAVACDAADPVNRAALFALPDGLTYLVGHSLGPATHLALTRVREAAQEGWAKGLVRSWNLAGWLDLAGLASARIAALIGARPSEVSVADNVSVNLFKLAAAALPLARIRAIMVEADEFPTDLYVAQSLAALVGAPLRRIPKGEGAKALAHGGVLIQSLVHYRTAAAADMHALEAQARDAGAVIVWDLSHASGAMAVDLGAAQASFAAGCTYKYLNGGPGAPGYVFVADAVADRIKSPIAGWFGHAEPFGFTPDYRAAPGAAQFASGTPPILSLAALEAGLAAFDGVEVAVLGAKTRMMGAMAAAQTRAAGLDVADPPARGAHVAVTHPDGYAIVQALAERGVLADFRGPDTIRLGLSPLFLSFAEVWRAGEALIDIVRSGAHRDPRFSKQAKVT